MDKNQVKILLVDDDPGMRSLLTTVLKDEGYNVITASDGQEGLQRARNETPNLIILDVTMPKLSGYKVARMLKFDTRFEHIPIIMQTAKDSEAEVQTGLNMGVDAYLTKPYDPADLLNKIAELLNKEVEPVEV
ncbi:hypothetical protein A2291_04130 [candidate division WOR-1 bacterium RIFOXYB2_FULL_42_35]|uniref:Response regulatory domain-containing protein n=1 Tax=candidate division WOR-1 bacterium RIFOXYC2_FULL_41_25 TaxID=1802586 RepID=A0A1F4TMS4_UNCSA|nr:MAG: hypothetical protein A2247_00970 [candidate division WOR-1 bacterium RIFOXYA2_FULL_41_14]OGC24319.1 MAG: hypothetical protein A2291_04130 [candidate division WOR-1 bacterium RIFOXYB2_FULL_42_35]OGC34021.1 MAG: hypothetical protein A2462_01535 [candidate division WOR-1 bacterium RIFOXYC2_FULL_41_25]OGC43176.1 MAG: hypothetical protein A2548_03730 [candidate division WOR-1 bacterium RIFOXYD2_FULL_41_8]